MLRFVRRLGADRSGPTAIEYGLIAVLIVVATIAGLTAVGTSLNARDSALATAVGS